MYKVEITHTCKVKIWVMSYMYLGMNEHRMYYFAHPGLGPGARAWEV